MCFMVTKHKNSDPVPERYRRYEAAKRRIPITLSPREYEEEIKRLARRYRI